MNKIDVVNPRTGQVDYQADHYGADDVAAVAKRLRSAQTKWESAGIEFRVHQIRKWAENIEANIDTLWPALTDDTGRKTFARLEILVACAMLRNWADRAPGLLAEGGEKTSSFVPTVNFRHRLVPLPLVGVISPWNVPMILALIDTIPALLAGCAVLLKPSEVTPRFAKPLAKSLEGLEGLQDVVGIITGGADTGQALVDNVDAVCFTGSVATGRKVGAHAAANFIPAFLELGGKDPAIVLPSANIEAAVHGIVRSAIGLTGQACQSLERIYVHQDIYQPFLDEMVKQVSAVKFNWPNIDEGHIGPLIFGRQGETIQRHLDDAIAKGAKVLVGGKIEHHGGGTWCQPTVIVDVNHDMALMTEETFGPIVPVMPFATTEEAIALANDSEFGLSAALFSADPTDIDTIAAKINVGAVSINDASLTALVYDAEKNSFCMSGLGGSRMGDSGITRFLRKRALLVQTGNANPIDMMREGQF